MSSLLSTIQPLSSLWDGSANADTEGMVRIATCFAGSPGHTVVCIKRYGTYEWELLKNLSTVLWMRYRYRIHNSILYLKKKIIN